MFILFFLVWMILNGRVTVEIVIFGLVIAAAMYWFICKFMDYSWKYDVRIFKCIPLIIRYLFVLVKEIIKANLTTMKICLTPGKKYEPALVRFKTDLKTKTARVVLANSITLTPGTITVSLEEDEYVVHCLDKKLAQGIDESGFVKLLRKMEGVG